MGSCPSSCGCGGSCGGGSCGCGGACSNAGSWTPPGVRGTTSTSAGGIARQASGIRFLADARDATSARSIWQVSAASTWCIRDSGSVCFVKRRRGAHRPRWGWLGGYSGAPAPPALAGSESSRSWGPPDSGKDRLNHPRTRESTSDVRTPTEEGWAAAPVRLGAMLQTRRGRTLHVRGARGWRGTHAAILGARRGDSKRPRGLVGGWRKLAPRPQRRIRGEDAPGS